ncbi:MAG: helix-turn-helix domain-containing protein [Pseudomonadota bacterium]
MAQEEEHLYTPEEIAKQLKLNKRTIYRYIREGKLKAAKFGRVYRTTKTQLDSFIAQSVDADEVNEQKEAGLKQTDPKKPQFQINIEEVKGEISKLCSSHHIKLLYLFGSAASGKMGTMSDVDFAFLSDDEIHLNIQIEIAHKIAQMIGVEEVDLVDLHDATPLLLFEVIDKGILLFRVSDLTRAEFEFYAISKYLQTVSLRNQFSKYLRQTVQGGNFYVDSK